MTENEQKTDPAMTPADGLIMCEIEDLANLETLFGDELGLMLMKGVEQRLRKALPRNVSLWRQGRGCFAVGVPKTNAVALRSMGRGLQADLAQKPVRTRRGDVAVTMAVGCALALNGPRGALGPTARRALQRAAAKGRSRIMVLQAEAADDPREEIASRAEAAVRTGEIEIHVQPVRRIDGHGMVAFHECLARLTSHTEQPLPATQFLPHLKGSGLVTELDRFVLTRALDALADQPQARLSVNVAPQTLDDPRWMRLLLQRASLRPGVAERLIVEVSEATIVADEMRAASTFEQLRNAGVSLALDDFGRGEIGTHHFQRLRFDMVKIGGGFVRNLTTSEDTRDYIETLISLAGRFELMIVAKSVEGREEARWLEGAGVDHGQGTYFGAPTVLLERTAEHTLALSPSRPSASRSATASL